MKRKNVLITGAGGSATGPLVEHLAKFDRFNVYLSDVKPIYGLTSLAKKFIQVPMANDSYYLTKIQEIANQEMLDAIVPGVDEELLQFIEYRKKFTDCKVIMPSNDFVQLSLNKLELNRVLSDKGLPVPETYHIRDLSNIPETFLKKKIIAKPIQGRGSRGVFYLNSKVEVQAIQPYLLLKQPDSIFQELIEGTEYTVSVIVSKNGKTLAVIPKKIILKRGITIEAITERNKAVIEYCTKIVQLLNPKGPFNVQLILDKSGQPYVFEINPRFSTTTILTSESGFSEVAVSLLDAFDEPYEISEWKENVRLIRQWSNYFEQVRP